jgi:hypothetical protein
MAESNKSIIQTNKYLALFKSHKKRSSTRLLQSNLPCQRTLTPIHRRKRHFSERRPHLILNEQIVKLAGEMFANGDGVFGTEEARDAVGGVENVCEWVSIHLRLFITFLCMYT